MTNLKITWASVEDKIQNELFLSERRNMVTSLISGGKAKPIVINPIDKAFAVVSFYKLEDAQEYAAFIINLAAKYNKTILSIEYL
jgi:hypothetical protein